jgi:hypothetical protein
MTDEDGDHSGYSVFERVPKPQPEAKPEKHAGGFGDFDIIFLSSQRPESDPREVTLRARTQSMTAHHVSGVAFTTDEYEVHRHRIERRDWQGTRAKTPPSDFDF